jgi:hypothetical protein
VFLSDGSSKTLQKKSKKSCRKVLQNNRQKIQNRFFLDFFNHVFGRFSVRGVQKHSASQPTPHLRSHKAQNESKTATERTQRKL